MFTNYQQRLCTQMLNRKSKLVIRIAALLLALVLGACPSLTLSWNGSTSWQPGAAVNSSSQSNSEEIETEADTPADSPEANGAALQTALPAQTKRQQLENVLNDTVRELLFEHGCFHLVHWYDIQEVPIGKGNEIVRVYFTKGDISLAPVNHRENTSDIYNHSSIFSLYQKQAESGRLPGLSLYRLLVSTLQEPENQREEPAGHRFLIYLINRKIQEHHPDLYQEFTQRSAADWYGIDANILPFQSLTIGDSGTLAANVLKHIKQLPDYESVLSFHKTLLAAFEYAQNEHPYHNHPHYIFTARSSPFSEAEVNWYNTSSVMRKGEAYDIAKANGPQGLMHYLEATTLLSREYSSFRSKDDYHCIPQCAISSSVLHYLNEETALPEELRLKWITCHKHLCSQYAHAKLRKLLSEKNPKTRTHAPGPAAQAAPSTSSARKRPQICNKQQTAGTLPSGRAASTFERTSLPSQTPTDRPQTPVLDLQQLKLEIGQQDNQQDVPPWDSPPRYADYQMYPKPEAKNKTHTSP